MLASHDAVLRPTFSGHVVVRTGPVIPDVRVDAPGVLGVDVRLGKTDVTSTDELLQRYAAIAGQPEGQVAKVTDAVRDMALGAALRGGVLGLPPVIGWALVGAARRRELMARMHWPHLVLLGVGTGLVGLALWQPWLSDDADVSAAPAERRNWIPLGEFLGPGVPLPEEADGVEVSGDVTTKQTRRLVESAVDTYNTSKEFYAQAATDAAALGLRHPVEGDTVVVFVSDRHDNIGMDLVARAIADAAGATGVFDGGDDTSTGGSWEAFSLDSVTEAFDGIDKWGVAGNHDHGDFVQTYLADQGWTMLDGEIVEGPGDTTLLGVPDPRSSGLGNWRDETGLTFEEVEQRLADAACDADERVDTILVHDANLGDQALVRGCVDLVVGGHLHGRRGPERIIGSNGEVGYSYTTGTAGGAAYAFALGSKPRRPAEVSLITYHGGRPVGIQWVTLRTDGTYETGNYVPLRLPEDLPEVVEETEPGRAAR